MTTDPQIADDVTKPEKKEVQVIRVLVDNIKGSVKWYNIKRLYGFINREDNNEDVFVHRSAIKGTNRLKPTLRNGEQVEFSVVETTEGIEAANVTGPEGANVLGFRNRRNRRFGRGGKGAYLDGVKQRNTDSNEVNEEHSGVENTSEKEEAKFKKRRRPRKRQPVQNGDHNGTQSENEMFYEANGNYSPNAGQQRRPPRTQGGYRRGGFGGGRGGRRYFAKNRFDNGYNKNDESAPGEPRPIYFSRGMNNGMKPRGRGGRRGRGGMRGGTRDSYNNVLGDDGWPRDL